MNNNIFLSIIFFTQELNLRSYLSKDSSLILLDHIYFIIGSIVTTHRINLNWGTFVS